MMRSLAAVGVTACVLLAAPVAHAQKKFGDQGEFIISADRLTTFFSYSHWSQDLPPNMGASKVTRSGDQTSISLLYGSSADINDPFFTVPRLGFDYVIVPNVTIGGDAIVFFTLGSNSATDLQLNSGFAAHNPSPSPSTTVFGVAPRGGYILQMSELFSFWLRGGLSYYTGTFKTTQNGVTVTSETLNQWALDLDPQFVVTPIPHVGFTAGLAADIPFGGSHTTQTNPNGDSFSAFSSVFHLGVTIGMLAYF
jgi:hypothetical protein